jgi:hypothetical protein
MTGVMMGLSGSITPSRSGTVLILISGDMSNTTSGDGGKVQIRYGTGSAPANGAALAGTAAGAQPQMTCAGILSGLVSLSGCTTPLSTNAVVTSLSVGMTYWIDTSLAAVTGGTATIKNVSITAIEL